MNRGKLIHYMTSPELEVNIDINKITILKDLLKDFDYSIINDQYDFIHKDLEVIITQKGTILISMIVYSDLADNLALLSKFINKINFIVSVRRYSEKVDINDLKDVSYLRDLVGNANTGCNALGVS
jgi:hypothetical protein